MAARTTRKTETTPTPSDGSIDKPVLWVRTATDWGTGVCGGETAFVCPGRPHVWRNEVPHYAPAADELDRVADRRAVETVRRRAINGDPHAWSLVFRAARGPARPVVMAPMVARAEEIHPSVAEAAIEAGLAAFELLPEEEQVKYGGKFRTRRV